MKGVRNFIFIFLSLFLLFNSFSCNQNLESADINSQNGSGGNGMPSGSGGGGPGGGPGGGGAGCGPSGGSSTITPTCSDSNAKSITYSFTTATGTKVTYYAKYLVDGSSDSPELNLTGTEISCSGTNEIAVLAINGGTVNLTDCTINKSGGGSGLNGDAYNFYGVNNAVVSIGKKSVVNSTSCTVKTTSEYANAVFAADEGSVNILSGITITTKANSARGLFAAYSGKVSALEGGVNISTEGSHCAPLATDRGGGTIIVGSSAESVESVINCVANDSPVIYSTGVIKGWKINGTCVNGQAIVVEGKNTVELNSCTLKGGRPEQGFIFMYQSTSGDAADSDASSTSSYLKITDCTFIDTNKVGMFTITHTKAAVESSNCKFYYGTSGTEYTANASLTTGYLILCTTVNKSQWGDGNYLTFTTSDALKGTLYAGDSTSSLTVSCGSSSQVVKASASKGTVVINVK